VFVLGHVAMLVEWYSLVFTELKIICFYVVLALYAPKKKKKGHEVRPYFLWGENNLKQVSLR